MRGPSACFCWLEQLRATSGKGVAWRASLGSSDAADDAFRIRCHGLSVSWASGSRFQLPLWSEIVSFGQQYGMGSARTRMNIGFGHWTFLNAPRLFTWIGIIHETRHQSQARPQEVLNTKRPIIQGAHSSCPKLAFRQNAPQLLPFHPTAFAPRRRSCGRTGRGALPMRARCATIYATGQRAHSQKRRRACRGRGGRLGAGGAGG